MGIRKIYLIVFFLLIIGSSGCKSNVDAVQKLPEGVPWGSYTDGIVQLFLPTYYNEKTVCYYTPKPGATLKNESDFTVVNALAGDNDAKIGFLLILKPNTGFIVSGREGLALFRYDEEKEDWEEIAYTIDESTPIWENGDVLAEGSYWNIGKEKCHYFPESPIYLYPQNEKGMIHGTYRLYLWGSELDKTTMWPSEFLGDYVEFTWGPEE